MGIWESIAFLLLCIVFIALLIFAPMLVEMGIKRSLPFRAEEAEDIVYDNGVLTFVTQRGSIRQRWSFKGNCTVWYWVSSGKRCSSPLEYELVRIWTKTK